MKQILLAIAFILMLCTTMTIANAEEDYPVHHVVVKGDTLWYIAGYYHLDLNDLISMNPQIENPHWIYPKDKVFLPQPTFNDMYYQHQ